MQQAHAVGEGPRGHLALDHVEARARHHEHDQSISRDEVVEERLPWAEGRSNFFDADGIVAQHRDGARTLLCQPNAQRLVLAPRALQLTRERRVGRVGGLAPLSTATAVAFSELLHQSIDAIQQAFALDELPG